MASPLVTNGQREMHEEVRAKGIAMDTLKWRLQAQEGEILALRQKVAQLEEEKRESEVRMLLLQEEASQSLSSMVEAQQQRRREGGENKEREEQLEMQVVSQAEELRHIRLQLLEETQAHRDDVEESERRWRAELRRLRVQLQQAKGLGDRSVSHPDVSLQLPPSPGYNILSPHSPKPHNPHRRLFKTLSVDPPPFHTLQSTHQATGVSYTLPRSPYQKAPATFHTGVSTFHDNLCYFSSFMTNQIHVYNTALGAWHLLPECPVSNFGLEVVNNLVTTIGGRLVTAAVEESTSVCTNKLLSLCGQGAEVETGRERWVEKVPAMVLARAQAATTSNSRLVIVAGGEVGDHRSFIADIEVLLVDTGTWSRLASSPLGNYSWLTAVLCGDQLYLVEGLGSREKDKIHSVHMGAVVESIQPPPTGRTRKASNGNLPWKRIKPAPASNTTCVCAKGKLIAVGGIDANGKSTNDIWAFHESSWKSIGSLKSYRYRSLVGVTAIGTLLVIGGLTKTRLTDHMEIFDMF